MHIVIAPDSFKGSLSAKEVALTIREAFLNVSTDFNIQVVPMADGGEGTLEALIYATQGVTHSVEIKGPLLENVTTKMGILGDQETVVLEAANICGLTMVPTEKRNPFLTSSYGLGQAMRIALDQGYRKFVIGLGGSATNDGGLGLLQALGAEFTDENGKPVEPIGQVLKQITAVRLEQIDKRIQESEILIANDVTNPLCGENGASAVFGPQKGATLTQVQQLDQGLQKYARLIEEQSGLAMKNQPGAGAAGGLGFALLILGGKMRSGADVVGQATSLQQKIALADWVITGEGRTDFQTNFGKLPIYVASLAQQENVKTILLSGSIDPNSEDLYRYFVSLHSIMRQPISLTKAMKQAKKLLYDAAFDLARLLHHTKGVSR